MGTLTNAGAGVAAGGGSVGRGGCVVANASAYAVTVGSVGYWLAVDGPLLSSMPIHKPVPISAVRITAASTPYQSGRAPLPSSCSVVGSWPGLDPGLLTVTAIPRPRWQCRRRDAPGPARRRRLLSGPADGGGS